jgi:hypothetical protein
MSEDSESESQHNLPAHLTQTGAQLWERQPRESDREWAIFSCYRMSGYENQDAAQAFKPRHLAKFAADYGLSAGTVYQLSGQWSWNERCAAYDLLVDRQKTHASLSALERMRSRHEHMDAMRYELWVAAQARLLDDFLAGRVTLKPHEVDALGKTLQGSEMLRNGEATARTESRSLNVSVSLQGAPAEVREWYRAQALAAQNSEG